jgi:hypothetical protein
MTSYRAKIEMDLHIHDWGRAREIALAWVKDNRDTMASANPGETMDQLARRVVGDDKLVADAVAIAILFAGAQQLAAADIGNIGWSLTATE